jgi:hypothetical protein
MKITATQDFLDEYNRYEAGRSYDVPPAKGQYFLGHGWADNAAKDAELDEPLDTSTVTDEEADRFEAVHAEVRQRDLDEGRIVTETATGAVYRRVGDEIQELRAADVPTDDNHAVLDVQDAGSGSGTNL